ncbi:MAG: response regulator [Rhodobacteraceae bacterium]|nr:response regulator [Paracoccaceae bacterium]
MENALLRRPPLPPSSRRLRFVPYLALLAILLLYLAVTLPPQPFRVLVLGAGTTIATVASIILISALWAGIRARLTKDAIADFVEHDASPSFVTDVDGAILYRNAAAIHRFAPGKGDTLSGALRTTLAAPGEMMERLKTRAGQTGHAQEDVALRSGHLRVSVHALQWGNWLWRFEDMSGVGDGLGAAQVRLPVLTVSDTGTIVGTNEVMRQFLGRRERSLDRVVSDLPLREGGIHEIATTSGPEKAAILEFKAGANRRDLYFLPLASLPTEAPHDWELVEGLPVPVMKLNPGGKILSANRLATELFGGRTLAGHPLHEMLEGLGRPIGDWLLDAGEGRTVGRPEVLRIRGASRETFLQVTLGRMVEEDGVELLAVLSDATELKTLEAKFVQSQKMQAVGQLAGGIAHDFNNLLTAISGHCDLLLLRHEEDDEDHADLIQIGQNANRAAALVSQLLAFSRKQTLRRETVPLAEALADHATLLDRLVGEKIRLEVTHLGEGLAIRADKRQFEQVIMNLVVNARDAMPDGGEISIETQSVDLNEPLHRDRATVPAGSYAKVTVSDTGTGIPPDRIGKIFEPFFTTKRAGEGTGLGLSTVYGIVKQTGGYVFCDSRVGAGTSFTIYLPKASGDVPEEAPAPRTAEVSDAAQSSGVVLLVEDEAPVRAFAARALRMRGYVVIEAADGEEALHLLQDQELSVDVFVTDVVMPGMDGPTWVTRALNRRPGAKVVFVSGYAEENFAAHQAQIPNSVYLPKPFSLTELTATVQGQLH